MFPATAECKRMNEFRCSLHDNDFIHLLLSAAVATTSHVMHNCTLHHQRNHIRIYTDGVCYFFLSIFSSSFPSSRTVFLSSPPKLSRRHRIAQISAATRICNKFRAMCACLWVCMCHIWYGWRRMPSLSYTLFSVGIWCNFRAANIMILYNI